MMTLYLLTSAFRKHICFKLAVGDLPSDKYSFVLCIYHVVFGKTPSRYVMSQSIFSDQIRLRPFIACLNFTADLLPGAW